MNKISTERLPLKRKVSSDHGEEFGTETEADKHLKTLLGKQLDTEFTLTKQFEQHRQFAQSSTYKSSTEAGQHSLQEFLSSEILQQKKEELGQCGLTAEEVELYLSSNGYQFHRNKNVHPDILKQQLLEIKEKINNHKNALSKSIIYGRAKQLNRHEMDIEKSLYAGLRKKHHKTLVTHSCCHPHQDDPFSCIKEISQAIAQKQKKQVSENFSYSNQQNEVIKKIDPTVFHAIIPLEETEILKNKLSLEQIREIPRFHNYDPGQPSKVLFIKNIDSKVRVEEIIALFERFQSNNSVKYRLLSGKMRGQSFVTFSDAETAEKALKLVNGYLLRGKPLIIHFARNDKISS